MKGNESVLAELAAANLEEAALKVHVGAVESQRLAGPQASAREQAEQSMQRESGQRTRSRVVPRGVEEARELFVAENPRWRCRPRPRERVRIERLGPRVEDREVFCEAPQHAMASRADRGGHVAREHEGDGELVGKRPFVSALPNELLERPQGRGLHMEDVPERAAELDVIDDLYSECGGEGAHASPPGKGSAMRASWGSATFT